MKLVSYLDMGRGVTLRVRLKSKELNFIFSLEIWMAPTVSVKARLKGAIVELITPSYDNDPSMKWCRLEPRWWQWTWKGKAICFLCRLIHSTLSIDWLMCLPCAPIAPFLTTGLAWIVLCSNTLCSLRTGTMHDWSLSSALGPGLDSELVLGKATSWKKWRNTLQMFGCSDLFPSLQLTCRVSSCGDLDR